MRREKGFTLIEVLIAMAILAVILTAFAGGFFTVSKVLRVTDERQTAKNLAQAQMEYVKNLPYSLSDPPFYSRSTSIDNEYPGYLTTNPIGAVYVTSPSDNVTMQKITVTVTHQGSQFTLQDYKVSR